MALFSKSNLKTSCLDINTLELDTTLNPLFHSFYHFY